MCNESRSPLRAAASEPEPFLCVLAGVGNCACVTLAVFVLPLVASEGGSNCIIGTPTPVLCDSEAARGRVSVGDVVTRDVHVDGSEGSNLFLRG